MARNSRGGNRCNIRHFGFDASDATTAVQAALDSGSAAVEVPYLSGAEVLVQPLTMPSNKTLYLNGGHLKSHSTGYGIEDANLLTVALKTNFAIVGEGAATIEMRRVEDTEQAHCIDIIGSTKGLVENLTLKNGDGDGLYIGPDITGDRVPSEDITAKGLIIDAARRNGISITAARRVLIKDSTIQNVSGTSPQASIDIEPNDESDPCVDITVRNVRSVDTTQCGFLVSVSQQDSTSEAMSILFDQCSVVGPTVFGIRAVHIDPDDNGASGTIEFRDITIRDTSWQGIWPNWEVNAAATLRFTRCVVHGPTLSAKIPIHMDLHNTVSAASTGGIVFDNCWIIDTVDRDPITFTADEGLEDPDLRVTGTIYVVNPNLPLGAYDAGITGLTVTVVPAFIPPR